MFSVPAVHSPPLSSEYFASALISVEIKFISVLLNVNFLFQKMQYHVELIINI